MRGSIDRTHGVNPAWEIHVEGYPRWRFMDYTKREAIRQYRRQFHLVGRRIEWCDYTLPDMPHNLHEAVMQALQSPYAAELFRPTSASR